MHLFTWYKHILYIKYCTKIVDFTVEIVISYHYHDSGAFKPKGAGFFLVNNDLKCNLNKSWFQKAYTTALLLSPLGVFIVR